VSDAFEATEFENPSEEEIRRLLERVRRIAVVGLSPKPHRDSHRVGRYLLDVGYTVIPIYPREEKILGQTVYRRVQEVPGGVDLVDVFRRREELPRVFDDALASRAPAIWLQLDCIDEDGARRAAEAGVTVVMDRCLAVDHARLLGRNWRPASSVPTQMSPDLTKT
jgi:predicted CoA-binding protein